MPFVEAHEGVDATQPGPSSHVGRWLQVLASQRPEQRFEQLVFSATATPKSVRDAMDAVWKGFQNDNDEYVNKALDRTYQPAATKLYPQFWKCAPDNDPTDKEP